MEREWFVYAELRRDKRNFMASYIENIHVFRLRSLAVSLLYFTEFQETKCQSCNCVVRTVSRLFLEKEGLHSFLSFEAISKHFIPISSFFGIRCLYIIILLVESIIIMLASSGSTLGCRPFPLFSTHVLWPISSSPSFRGF